MSFRRLMSITALSNILASHLRQTDTMNGMFMNKWLNPTSEWFTVLQWGRQVATVMLRKQQQWWAIPWFHLAHLCHLTCVTLLRSVLHATSYPTGGGVVLKWMPVWCCWLALIVFISSFFPLIVVLLPWVSKLSGEIVLIVSFYGV